MSSTDAILAQNKLITQQIELLNKNFAQLMPQQAKVVSQPQADVFCEICGGNHSFEACPYASVPHENVQFINNQQRQGNFSNQPFRPNAPPNFQQG